MNRNINIGFVVLICTVAAMGGLMFGFDIAIITGANPFLEQFFELTKVELGLGTSSLLFGCIFGSFFAGRLADIFGRKPVLYIMALLFALTSLATALSPTFWFYVAARFIGGLAVGAASMASPMYISEVSPSKMRGKLVSFYQLSIVTGILISYLINYLLSDAGDNNWRWMFATGVIPSAILAITLFLVPETPRYLTKKGKEEAAFAVLKKINGEEVATVEMKQIKESLHETKTYLKDLLKPEYRRMMAVGIVLSILVQVSGINAIIDYAPFIFKSAGFRIDTALFATFGLGVVNVISTFISIYTVDRLGRKKLYIIGSAGMSFSLILLTILSFTNTFSGGLVLLLCIIYLFFFAGCIGPVYWTLITEIFPNKIRGTAMAIPVLTQWFFNALMVMVFPHMLDTMPAVTFGGIAVMAMAQLLFALKYVPETKGKTLEEIEMIWKNNNE